MSAQSHRSIGKVFVALALATLAAWQLPGFLSLERYRRSLEAGLERTLHRRVTFSHASLRVLPRPGFAIQKVLVREDSAFGTEPFAQVDRMECDLRWRSLWRSRFVPL